MTFLAQAIQRQIEPWEAWAKTDPMRHKIAGALRLLDRDGDDGVLLDDLNAHRAVPPGRQHITSRQVQTFYATLKKRDNEGEQHRERIKHALLHLSEKQLAEVIVHLPVFLAHQPKPLALRLLNKNQIAYTATEALNHFLMSIEAPTVAPEVFQHLLAAMGTAKSAPAR